MSSIFHQPELKGSNYESKMLRSKRIGITHYNFQT
jgi:hypothetical protein